MKEKIKKFAQRHPLIKKLVVKVPFSHLFINKIIRKKTTGLPCSFREVKSTYKILTGEKLQGEMLLSYKEAFYNYIWDTDITLKHLLTNEKIQEKLWFPQLNREAITVEAELYNKQRIIGLNTDFFIMDVIKKEKIYEPEHTWLVEKIIKDDSVALDIGANIGYFTAVMADKISKGKIYTIEAVPMLAGLIEKSKKICGWNNVEILNTGLYDGKGDLTVRVNYVNPGCFRVLNESDELEKIDKNIVEQVSLDTLDNLLYDKLSRLDYIKMDVEGAEGRVFKGGKKIIEKFKPVVTWEFTPSTLEQNGTPPKELLTYLSGLGYKFLPIDWYSWNEVDSIDEVLLKEHLSVEKLLHYSRGHQFINILMKVL